MAKKDKDLINRMAFLRDLLKENGLRLCGYDPGITATKDGRYFDFGMREWEWLEPILIELRELRKMKNDIG